LKKKVEKFMIIFGITAVPGCLSVGDSYPAAASFKTAINWITL
jgi:hypothetical protein